MSNTIIVFIIFILHILFISIKNSLAVGLEGERPAYIREITGSNPVRPTIMLIQRRGIVKNISPPPISIITN